MFFISALIRCNNLYFVSTSYVSELYNYGVLTDITLGKYLTVEVGSKACGCICGSESTHLYGNIDCKSLGTEALAYLEAELICCLVNRDGFNFLVIYVEVTVNSENNVGSNIGVNILVEPVRSIGVLNLELANCCAVCRNSNLTVTALGIVLKIHCYSLIAVVNVVENNLSLLTCGSI